MKFCWCTIHVKDLEQSLTFYKEIVGLTEKRRFKAGPNMEIVFLGEGETQIELISDQNKEDIKMSNDLSIGFEVPSLEEMMKTLEKYKIAVHSGPFEPNPHIRFFYVLDPSGVKVQFVESK